MMIEPPFSRQYNDIYFSVHDGLAEKRYVFQNGNDLPARFKNRNDFVIAEAGFGTGLSFLATAQTFLEHTAPHQHLHFISFEAHPMTTDQIRSALSPWASALGDLIDDMITALPLTIPGTHDITLKDRIHLTLVYGDIKKTIQTLDRPVDAWYLDGFTPAKNPTMWGAPIFNTMKNWSATGATAATYSAARIVRDGLQSAGFTVQKTKGFGYKSDMVRGTLATNGRAPLHIKRGQRIAILGGGLAGTAAAWALKQSGQNPIIIAPFGLADGASGNIRGLYNPRFSKNFTDMAAFYSTAFAAFHYFLKSTPENETGWIQNGALHLIRSDDNAEKLNGIINTWGWDETNAQMIEAKATQDIAGIPLAHDALWLPHAGSVNPQKICAAYANGIEIRPDTPDLRGFDAVVIASGMAALNFPGLEPLPLRPVRGQIILAKSTDQSRTLRTNLCYGGYMTPVFDDGTHAIGATFTRGETSTEIRTADTSDILKNMSDHLHLTLPPHHVIGARAGVRVTTPDHRPIIQQGPNTHNDLPTYLSLAHGSHGLLSTHLAGRHIAKAINQYKQLI